MKREIKYLIIGLLILCAAGAILYFITHPPKDTDSDNTFTKVPGRLTELGPYAKNISLTENIGAAEVELTPGDLSEINAVASKIVVQGKRYPEKLEKLTGR